ncbi:MAG: anthrone oxygenase family protein [Planctomycetota bacterium]
MSQAVPLMALAASVGAGLIAGVFFAFSTFVMRGLAGVSPEAGVAAMQSINRTVFHPLMMGLFIGLVPAGLVFAGLAWYHGWTGWEFIVAGAALYAVGTFGITAAFNVPLNNALDAVEAGSAQADELWARYLDRWTFWNHMRTIAAVLAAAAYALALIGF